MPCAWKPWRGRQCLVTNTADITPARLAHLSMEARAREFAVASLDIAQALSPQHVLVEMGPCGLPLDAASKASLNEATAASTRAPCGRSPTSRSTRSS